MIETIEKIHKEFDESHIALQDLLNNQNSKLVSLQEEHQNKYADIEVYQTLINTAFQNIDINEKVANVTAEKLEIDQKVKYNEQQIEAIKMHNELLPFYKFLTVPQLYKILNKYNLFVGKSKLYTGSIPSKNAKEFVKFGKAIEKVQCSNFRHDTYYSSLNLLCEVDKSVKHNVTRQGYLDYYIVAPEHDFKLADNIYTIGNEKFEGLKFDFKTFRAEASAERMRVKDPVILKAFTYKGCLLLTIVTKWGLEALKPEFQNSIDN